ncbi:MAG: zinc ABC transporter substrate-binding protein [Actinobacteria bacterium]|nr:zinc ABC transporter substrate-binding protein [Actinomycetota bacterium]
MLLKKPASVSNLGARVAALVICAAALVALAGCGGGGASSAGGKVNVVAAEDFWGSIAEGVGGDRVAVTDIITNPAADPHDYEATANDARAMAGAQVSIVNGIGYDEWASKLLAAGPDEGRVEVEVGDVLGLEAGDNPHQWYSPESVHKVIAALVEAFEEADPGHDSYYEERAAEFEKKDLARYNALIAQISEEFDGTKVGASESIFEPLAPALGLDLVTPAGFMDGIAEGTEPSPSEKATTDRQIEDGEIDLWVYNSQNATPDVKRLNEAAEAAAIPIATVTETLTPEGATFQAWMVRELEGIQKALREGKGSG